LDRLFLFDKHKSFSLDPEEEPHPFDISAFYNLHYLKNYLAVNSCDILLFGSGYPEALLTESIRDTKENYPHICLAAVIEEDLFSKALSYMDAGIDIILRRGSRVKELVGKYENWKERKICGSCSPSLVQDENKLPANISGKKIHIMSRSTRYRYYKKNYGRTEKEIFIEEKIKTASSLLLENRLPIKSICSLSGFDNPYYFSRWFKKHTGKTPTQYRAQYSRAGKVIQIGLLVPFSGPYGSCGINLLKGALFALEYRQRPSHYSYKVVPIDTGTSSDLTVKRMKYYIENEHIELFTGGISSDVIHSAINLAVQKDVLFLNTQGIDYELETHKNIFRWPLPSEEIIQRTLRSSLDHIPTKAACYTLTADYSYGHKLLEKTKSFFDRNDLYLSGNFFHKPGEINFFPLLNELSLLEAKYLVLLNYGPDTVRVLQQAYKTPLRDTITIIAPCTDINQEVIQAGNLFPEGVYLGTQYYIKKNLTENQKFKEAWCRKYHFYPSPVTVGGYIGIKILVDAIEKEATKRLPEIIEIMENLRWKGLTQNFESMDPESHQSEKNYFLFNSREITTADQCGKQII